MALCPFPVSSVAGSSVGSCFCTLGVLCDELITGAGGKGLWRSRGCSLSQQGFLNKTEGCRGPEAGGQGQKWGIRGRILASRGFQPDGLWLVGEMGFQTLTSLLWIAQTLQHLII